MSGKRDTRDLGFEVLEVREVPAHLAGGDLLINGSAGNDRVVVREVTVNGVDMIRVNQNRSVQFFASADVTGRVVFRGRGGDDAFGGLAAVPVDARGGAGNDLLGVTTTAGAILRGGRGDDMLLGGPGDDLLIDPDGGGHYHTGGGNDLYNGAPPSGMEYADFHFVPGTEPRWVRRLGRGG